MRFGSSHWLKENDMLEPQTLGDYRRVWAVLAGEKSSPVAFLDERIARQGADEKVIAAPSQMMSLLRELFTKDQKAKAEAEAEGSRQ